LSSTPPDLVDRGFDLIASQPDISQGVIVQFMKRFDRGPAHPIGGEAIGPDFDQTDKSAPRTGGGRSCCGRRDRGHFSFSDRLSAGKAVPPAQPLLDSGCTLAWPRIALAILGTMLDEFEFIA
jgi:hypothetical protein